MEELVDALERHDLGGVVGLRRGVSFRAALRWRRMDAPRCIVAEQTLMEFWLDAVLLPCHSQGWSFESPLSAP